MTQIFRILYHIAVTIFALCIFLSGYFPIKSTKSILQEEKYSYNTTRKPVFHRSVLMVIDAMRIDFTENESFMPKLANALQNSKYHGCTLLTKVETPTVTLPRIKALTMGSIPNFVDIIWNLGSKVDVEDSVLHQLKKLQKKIYFFGDDTWLRLFRNCFSRYEGTTSFYVTDYTEVDHNVTVRVKENIDSSEWDMMILHYLGLDHIGHMHGPFSSLIPDKLKEMDEIIHQILSSLKTWELKENKRALFIITSDHGMKNTGGHGGSTIEEINVPLITFGIDCPKEKQNIAQIDIAATLAVLLGTSIPTTSIGKFIPSFLNKINVIDQIQIYENYFLALKDKIAELAPFNFQNEIDNIYLNIKEYLISDNVSTSKILQLYESGINKMSSFLVSKRGSIDFYSLIVSLILLVSTLIALTCSAFVKQPENLISVKSIFIGMGLFMIHFVICLRCDSFLCHSSMWMHFLQFIFIVVLANNIYSILVNKIPFNIILSKKFFGIYICFCIILHSILLNSTSFIEQEQEIWYYFTSFLLVYMFYTMITSMRAKPVFLFLWSFIVIAHRLLKLLNCDYCFGEWTKNNNNNLFYSFFYLLNLIVIAWIAFYYYRDKRKSYFLVILNLISIYLYKASAGEVFIPFALKFSEIFIGQFCLLIITILFLIHLCQLSQNRHINYCIDTFIIIWILFNALLLKTHNIILIPLLILMSIMICIFMKNAIVLKTILHIWMGQTFFYFQGNSNSLSTIDVGVAYVGLTSYNSILVGSFLLIHTYSMPILSYLLLLKNLFHNENVSMSQLRNMLNQIYLTILITRLIPLSSYCLTMIVQHSHLFIWSVFSPKMIYEFVHTLLISSFICLIEIIFNLSFINFKTK